jgi:glyoxylate/hydroxypyruvate reductase A
MLVLLTSVARDSFGSRLARPGIEWLVLQPDGTLRDHRGAPVDDEEARADVAWGTSDLFRPGAPLGAFFGLLVRMGSLRWFQSPAAGFDSPVFSQLASRGVRISNAHVNSVPIAEFVLRSVLEEFQQADRWRTQAGERTWVGHDWRELAGTTWLVVGLGHIGSEVAVRARAFGATVIGCRRTPSADDPVDRAITPDQLLGSVGDADVVVLSAPAGPQTTGLVDAGFLARMRPGSLLVNVARGSLVDEDALLASLGEGRPAVAVLDVYATEPLPPENPFWSHPSVRVTPHNAAGGSGRLVRQADLFADNLDRYLSGRPLLNDVTADLGAPD